MTEAFDRLQQIVGGIPYAAFLNLRMELAGDEMTAVLPYSEHLIGNPTVPALHGGVIGAFMELTALTQLAIIQQARVEGPPRQPRPIGVTVEYLRSGRPIDTFARAQVKRLGRRIANVYVEAWQETRSAPIAALHARFLLTPQGPAAERLTQS
jgi:acyl-coenzyme A thioesterase PaaI-like protein